MKQNLSPIAENTPLSGAHWGPMPVIVQKAKLLKLCQPCPCPVGGTCLCTDSERGSV